MDDADAEWAKRNAALIVKPKKHGAGRITFIVQASAKDTFGCRLDKREGGTYGGRCHYKIVNKYITVSMPRNWNFVTWPDVTNVALPDWDNQGPCVRLVQLKSSSYFMRFEKGYLFKGHYVPTLCWSKEAEQSVIVRLVAQKLEKTHA